MANTSEPDANSPYYSSPMWMTLGMKTGSKISKISFFFLSQSSGRSIVCNQRSVRSPPDLNRRYGLNQSLSHILLHFFIFSNSCNRLYKVGKFSLDPYSIIMVYCNIYNMLFILEDRRMPTPTNKWEPPNIRLPFTKLYKHKDMVKYLRS